VIVENAEKCRLLVSAKPTGVARLFKLSTQQQVTYLRIGRYWSGSKME
jgi:hypothetical protein